jgi:hypothetical protein
MAALGDGHVEDTTFRRLSYEIAFSEYAMGLGYELSKQDPNMPPDDLLYEVRSTLNRISTAAVALYRSMAIPFPCRSPPPSMQQKNRVRAAQTGRPHRQGQKRKRPWVRAVARPASSRSSPAASSP